MGPDWVRVAEDGRELNLALDAPGLSPDVQGEGALPSALGEVAQVVASQRDEGLWRAQVPEATEAAMLRVDGRWIARWWPP